MTELGGCSLLVWLFSSRHQGRRPNRWVRGWALGASGGFGDTIEKLQCSARSLHRSFRQKTAMQFSAFAIYWCKMPKTAMQLFARLHFSPKNCNAVFVRCTAFPSRVCQRLHQPPLRSRVCTHTPRQVTTDPQCANHTNRLWLCT